MLADFFNKIFQESFFWRLREVIMVWEHVDIPNYYVPPSKKERLEIKSWDTNQKYCKR